jgi:hypothetical protein
MDQDEFNVSIYLDLLNKKEDNLTIANYAKEKKLSVALTHQRKKRLNSMSEESKGILANFA